METSLTFSSLLRTTPVQRRSAERMEALLDSAASLIDEGGVDAVTTTAVAYRSGSSVGVLYRYFPNIDTLLRELARRNLEKYIELVEQAGAGSSDEPWSSSDKTLDAFVTLCRREPGFRLLRFGDIITDRFLSTDEANTRVIAKELARLFAEAHSIPVTEKLVFHLEIAVAMGQSLMTEAFRVDPQGDERYITEAHQIIGHYLRTSFPLA